MDTYLILPLIEVVFGVGLLLALSFSGLRHVARMPFVVFLGFMLFWGFFIFMMRASGTLEEALFWEYFVFFSILSAALAFYVFSTSFTGNKHTRPTSYVLVFLYIVSIALIPTGLIVKGMQTMWYGKAPVIGPAFPLYVLCVYVPLVLSLIMLLRQYRRTKNLNEKTRDSYVIAGIIIMFLGGTTDYLPVLGINMYPMGIVGNIIFCLLATFAMLRYGLLEFQFVLRRGAAIALLTMLVLGIVGIIIFVINNMFGGVGFPAVIITLLIVMLAFAPIAQPLSTKIQRIVDRGFYGGRYEHMQALETFCKETKDIVDLDELSTSLVKLIVGAQAI